MAYEMSGVREIVVAELGNGFEHVTHYVRPSGHVRPFKEIIVKCGYYVAVDRGLDSVVIYDACNGLVPCDLDTPMDKVYVWDFKANRRDRPFTPEAVANLFHTWLVGEMIVG